MTAKVLNSSIAGETNYYELFIFYKEVSVWNLKILTTKKR
jgi:hypothetical protein